MGVDCPKPLVLQCFLTATPLTKGVNVAPLIKGVWVVRVVDLIDSIAFKRGLRKYLMIHSPNQDAPTPHNGQCLPPEDKVSRQPCAWYRTL